MSKKHKRSDYQIPQVSAGAVSHAAEYRIIKMDLIKVVILNLVYLAVILSLYFGNLHSHFLDNWFAKVLHF
jgi:hypothetical protein